VKRNALVAKAMVPFDRCPNSKESLHGSPPRKERADESSLPSGRRFTTIEFANASHLWGVTSGWPPANEFSRRGELFDAAGCQVRWLQARVLPHSN